jgi:hypothetical protein
MDADKAGRSLYFLLGFYAELIYDFHGNCTLGVIPFSNGWHLKEVQGKVNSRELLST